MGVVEDKIKNPVDYILNLENQDMDKIDYFIKPLNKYNYYVYVEDKGKIGFYELLFEMLYPEYKIMIFAKYSRKVELINYYFQEVDKNNFTNSIVLLDRDYESKLPMIPYSTLSYKCFDELKRNSHFRILTKTNIENYLIDYTIIKTAIKIVTSCSEEKFYEIKIEEVYIKIKEVIEKISFKYLINQCLMCDFPKTSKHVDFDSFNMTPIFETHLNNLKSNILKNKNKLEDLKNKVTYEEIKEYFKNKYSKEIDIDGKMFLVCLIQYCINKKIGNINKDIVTRVAIGCLTEDSKENLRKELKILDYR